MTRFVSFDQAAELLRGKSVAIVGSGPGVLKNSRGVVDSHDVVLRVNNHKTGPAQGYRTDVHYSFYGSSIRKTAAELKAEGVKLCWCRLPNAKPIESAWHERRGRQCGIDFRYIYVARKSWWFCDTYIPDAAVLLAQMALLGGHMPTTGFAAILDVLSCEPASVFLTGFDFFASKLHNVNERWKPGDPADPIGHRPEKEAAWVTANAASFTFDTALSRIIKGRAAA